MECEKKSQQSDLDSLAQNLRQIEGVSNEVADAIAKNWQRGLMIIAGFVLVIWFGYQYRENQKKMLDEAATGFTQAQGKFVELYGSKTDKSSVDSADKKEDAQKISNEELATAKTSFDDTMSLLIENSGSNVYSRLGALYKSVAGIHRGEIQESRNQLDTFNVRPLLTGGRKKPVPSAMVTPEQLLQELAALMYVKSFLHEASVDVPSVRAQLIELSYSTQVVCSESVLTLVRLSDTQEQRKEAIDVANAVILERPELGDDLRSELEKDGVIL